MTVEIRIRPTRELMFNEETSFGIYGAEVNPEDLMGGKVKLNQYGNISVKGTMPKLGKGEEYIVVVEEDTKSKYVGSYNVKSIKQEKPTSVADQKHFFSMIMTEKQVEAIFSVYEGQDVIGMIQDGTFDYTKVNGIGSATYDRMHEKVMNSLEMGELLVFLSKHDIKYNMVSSLVKVYGNPQIVIDKISKNPYILTEVKGIGFKKADAIAKAMGYDMKSPNRIQACIEYCLEEEESNGHTWTDRKKLLDKVISFLCIEKKLIESVLDSEMKNIINDGGRNSKKYTYEAEEYIAMRIAQLNCDSKKIFETEELEELLDKYCTDNSVELEENQHQFFHDWNENSVLALVGSGGMGKSWLLKILLWLVSHKHLSSSLLAPTGRASKVMTNYTGIGASTIHRRINKGIYTDMIVIDESSMCDVSILASLFSAIKNPNARVLFIGDDFQLPSVGAGNFLYDILHSNSVKISKLKKVFRQADGGILDVATNIREGKQFLNSTDKGRIVFGRDCVFWLVDQEFVLDGVLVNYKNVLKRFKAEDVAVLSPTNKGKLGTVYLNKELQKIANPASPDKKEMKVGKKEDPTIFRVGDLVMNTVNTYEIETIEGGVADIFNGDTGTIIDIDLSQNKVIIEFDDIRVAISKGDMYSSIVHAYSMSIHKSQGSQFKVVILVADKSMSYQLNANLLYTGLSRAQQYQLVICQPEVINRSMKKFINMKRRSFLQEFIDKFSGYEQAEILSVLNDKYAKKNEK